MASSDGQALDSLSPESSSPGSTRPLSAGQLTVLTPGLRDLNVTPHGRCVEHTLDRVCVGMENQPLYDLMER
jgi:hypothetical protein